MKYDFDRIVPRKGTYSEKWDAVSSVFPEANEDSISMFVADMDLPSPQPVIDAMHRVADFQIYGYTSPDTDPEFKNSFCRWFQRHHGWEVRPEEVIVSQGTFGALEHCVRTFSDEGDGVIIMRPVYGHFTDAIENEWDRKAVSNHLLRDEKGYYTIDYADLEQKCSNPNNKILIFCSPANPVGRVWTKEELRKVEEICERNHVLIISDEVHCDHLRKGITHYPFLSVAKNKKNIITLAGMNKSFNMAGLSCSNAVIQDESLRKKFLARYVLPWPSAFAVAGQIAAYNEGDEWMEQVCEYIEGNIDFAIDFFQKELPEVVICRPEGTYCLWLDFRGYGLSDREIHQRIYEKANVILQDGIIHDPDEGEGFQRMCVPCPRPLLKKACRRIADAFKDVN